jgi:hypothetical protein
LRQPTLHHGIPGAPWATCKLRRERGGRAELLRVSPLFRWKMQQEAGMASLHLARRSSVDDSGHVRCPDDTTFAGHLQCKHSLPTDDEAHQQNPKPAPASSPALQTPRDDLSSFPALSSLTKLQQQPKPMTRFISHVVQLSADHPCNRDDAPSPAHATDKQQVSMHSRNACPQKSIIHAAALPLCFPPNSTSTSPALQGFSRNTNRCWPSHVVSLTRFP